MFQLKMEGREEEGRKGEKERRKRGRKGHLENLLQKFIQYRNRRGSLWEGIIKKGHLKAKGRKNISGRFNSAESDSTILTGEIFNLYKCNLQLFGEL